MSLLRKSTGEGPVPTCTYTGFRIFAHSWHFLLQKSTLPVFFWKRGVPSIEWPIRVILLRCLARQKSSICAVEVDGQFRQASLISKHAQHVSPTNFEAGQFDETEKMQDGRLGSQVIGITRRPMGSTSVVRRQHGHQQPVPASNRVGGTSGQAVRRLAIRRRVAMESRGAAAAPWDSQR